MTLADLFRENLDVDVQDAWANEQTPTPARCFAVLRHSMGPSLREVQGVLELLGVDCCFQAAWNWKGTLSGTQSDPSTAFPLRVAVDETQIEVDANKKWLYAAIDTDSKLLSGVDVYSRRWYLLIAASSFLRLDPESSALRTVRSKASSLRANRKLSVKETDYNLLSWVRDNDDQALIVSWKKSTTSSFTQPPTLTYKPEL